MDSKKPNTENNTTMKTKIAFDEVIGKWIVFYTTDRIDYDFETGQELSPIMCDYHTVGIYNTKEEAQQHSN